eukprot:5294968-Lingulodinium_polyedra.AAC.1
MRLLLLPRQAPGLRRALPRPARQTIRDGCHRRAPGAKAEDMRRASVHQCKEGYTRGATKNEEEVLRGPDWKVYA